jgi:purine-binding chemotaxis protein CheW
MGREQTFDTGLAGLFSSEQAYPLDDPELGEMNRSQESAGAEGQVAMQDNQTEPVQDKAMEELVAAQDSSTAVEEAQAQADAPLDDRIPLDGPTVHLVVFALGDEQYAVDIGAVNSIIRMQAVTAVPRAPDFVEGLTNLRGTVLPVVDLHKRFGLPAQDTTKNTRIIVAESNGNKVGMRVDAVLEVRRVPEAALEPPSPLVATVDAAFVTGVAKVEEERLIILLDLERVLAHD